MYLITDAYKMISDIRSQSPGVWLWGGFLNIPQFLGGIYFIAAIEGFLVFVVLVLTQLVAAQIYRRLGFSRLCHPIFVHMGETRVIHASIE